MLHPCLRSASRCPAFLAAFLALAAPAGAGQLVLDPTNLSFGNVELVSTSTQTFRIVNHGTPTRIFGIDAIAGCTDFTVSAPGLPRVLQDADTLVVQVQFHPSTRIPYACVMEVHDDNGIADILGLTGVGIDPLLVVSDTLLSYRTQAFSIGVPETLWVAVQNLGNEAIQAPHLTVQFQSGADFQVGPVVLPIAPNASRNVPVVFHPATSGQKNDWLTFSLDNTPPADGVRIVHLQGFWSASTAVGDLPLPGQGLRLAPTPARGIVQLTFDAPRSGRASIEICDVAGRTLARIEKFVEGAGTVTATLKAGVDWSPEPGVYLARVSLGGRTLGAKRLVVIR